MLKIAIVQSTNGNWGYCPDGARAILRLDVDEDAAFPSAQAAKDAAARDESIAAPFGFIEYPAAPAGVRGRRHLDNARAPTVLEVDQIAAALRQPMGLDEQEGHDLAAGARIAVFDHFIGDGPGYTGRVALVLHSGGPEAVDVIVWRGGTARRIATTL
jgi:hypothetical protein